MKKKIIVLEKSVSKRQHEAAELLATGRIPSKEVARQIGVTPETVYRWMKDGTFAPFQQLVRDYQGRYAEQVYQRGLSRREVRVESLVNLHERMMLIVDGRAKEMSKVPGGASGLLQHDIKSVGWGAQAEIMDIYRFDAPLVEKIMEIQKEIATELGQRVEKKEISGTLELSLVTTLHEGRARVAEWRKVHGDKIAALPASTTEDDTKEMVG